MSALQSGQAQVPKNFYRKRSGREEGGRETRGGVSKGPHWDEGKSAPAVEVAGTEGRYTGVRREGLTKADYPLPIHLKRQVWHVGSQDLLASRYECRCLGDLEVSPVAVEGIPQTRVVDWQKWRLLAK